MCKHNIIQRISYKIAFGSIDDCAGKLRIAFRIHSLLPCEFLIGISSGGSSQPSSARAQWSQSVLWPGVAVTPKDTVGGNFVPKLDFIRYYRSNTQLFVMPGVVESWAAPSSGLWSLSQWLMEALRPVKGT